MCVYTDGIQIYSNTTWSCTVHKPSVTPYLKNVFLYVCLYIYIYMRKKSIIACVHRERKWCFLYTAKLVIMPSQILCIENPLALGLRVRECMHVSMSVHRLTYSHILQARKLSVRERAAQMQAEIERNERSSGTPVRSKLANHIWIRLEQSVSHAWLDHNNNHLNELIANHVVHNLPAAYG